MKQQHITIAAILTVHNRKEKTLECLKHLFEAQENYNLSAEKGVSLSVFITDDGCTDGTADAVMNTFRNRDIRILQGTGNMFWAGGMRFAWQAAIDSGTTWDYYLLLNDDTNMYKNVFGELFEVDEAGYKQTGKHGLASGITCQPDRTDEITYGGFLFTGRFKGRHVLAQPTGMPQVVDMTHANILLVHRETVAACGIFHKGFVHGAADEDYSMMARRRGFPVMVTSNVCGECPYDHDSNKGEIEQLMAMKLADRKKYVNSPTHSDSDYLLFVRRNLPLRYPIACLLRTLRLYVPKLYYHITHLRGIYKQ